MAVTNIRYYLRYGTKVLKENNRYNGRAKNYAIIHWILMLMILLYPLFSWGEPIQRTVIDVSDVNNEFTLTGISILEDKQNQFTIDNILFEQNKNFKMFDNIKLGFSESSFWVSFSVTNHSNEKKSVILRQNYPLIDYLEFWLVDNHVITKYVKTGDRELFSTREFDYKDFMFNISVEPGRYQTNHLFVQTRRNHI